jgi:hypothetical protein
MITYKSLIKAKYAWIDEKPFHASRIDGYGNNVYPQRGLYYLKALDVDYGDVLAKNKKQEFLVDII